MKKQDIILLISVVIFTWLFYRQDIGFNVPVMTTVLIVLLIWRNKQVLKERNWLAAAAGSLLSAIAVYLYGNGLAVVASLASLGLLSAFSLYPRASVPVSFAFSAASVFTSLPAMLYDTFMRCRKYYTGRQRNPLLQQLLVYGVPLGIVLLFFLIYKASNKVFDAVTLKINFDIVPGELLLCMFIGLLLLYGFFYYRRLRIVSDIDDHTPMQLYADTHREKFFSWFADISKEYLSGVLLLLLLNFLLLAVNTTDIVFLWGSRTLPEGVTYSDFVHQGTGLLILSIAIAIGIIMFYFRGGLNFYENRKLLRILAVAWIAQNAFMVISTAYRNDMYIQTYGLTYKRIGVYIWLLLALLGLLSTLWKITAAKSNWFLYRCNAWIWYIVLVVCSTINWAGVVTDYNIRMALIKHKPADKPYLLSLSGYSLPKLLEYDDSITHHKQEGDLLRNHSDYDSLTFKYSMGNRLYNFTRRYDTLDWQSQTMSDRKIAEALYALNRDSRLKALFLRGYDIDSLIWIKAYTHLKELHITRTGLKSFAELRYFSELKVLDISGNTMADINSMPVMHSIEIFSAASTEQKNLAWLNKIPAVQILHLQGNEIADYTPLTILRNLKELHLDAVSEWEYDYLRRLLPGVKIVFVCDANVAR